MFVTKKRIKIIFTNSTHELTHYYAFSKNDAIECMMNICDGFDTYYEITIADMDESWVETYVFDPQKRQIFLSQGYHRHLFRDLPAKAIEREMECS